MEIQTNPNCSWAQEQCLKLREGFIRKKKVENFLYLGPDPPPLKVEKDQNLFFFSDDLKDIFCRRKKNSLEKLEKFHKFGQYYWYFSSFGGQKGIPPPYEKKNFSADLHELRHGKIKIKRFRKWGKIVLTPLPV